MDEIVRQVVRTNERITTKQEDRMIDDISLFSNALLPSRSEIWH